MKIRIMRSVYEQYLLFTFAEYLHKTQHIHNKSLTTNVFEKIKKYP